MHLTNYAINKHNENFVRDDAMGSKRYFPAAFLVFCFLPTSSAPQKQLQETLPSQTPALCLSS